MVHYFTVVIIVNSAWVSCRFLEGCNVIVFLWWPKFLWLLLGSLECHKLQTKEKQLQDQSRNETLNK